jgi:hypothetical protein
MNYFTHLQAANFAAEEFRFADFGAPLLGVLIQKVGNRAVIQSRRPFAANFQDRTHPPNSAQPSRHQPRKDLLR